MTGSIGASSGVPERRWDSHLARLRSGPLSDYLSGETLEIGDPLAPVAAGDQASVLAAYRLSELADYRDALQRWFRAVRSGGHLVIVVPHAHLAERRLALPLRDQLDIRRLYTPASLLDEVEEALAPNSYRVRLLRDDDAGYDYASASDAPRSGNRDILLVLEKIDLPPWSLHEESPAPGPDYAFVPVRTRTETVAARPRRRILVLKLDHLGDFILGIDALRRVRSLFADAHLTLVVGSWNLDLARTLDLADELIAFDAFPRNSSEEEVDVPGKRALFDRTVAEAYDLAIDLRTDGDTRTLLARVRAPLRAGIGDRRHFPFLDIALPVDMDRIQREQAREQRYDHHAFSEQGSVDRLPHRALFHPDRLQRDCAIIWGPYHHLQPGRYRFDWFLEIDPAADGLLTIDANLNFRRAARAVIAAGDPLHLEFDVDARDTTVEFRIVAVYATPAPPVSVYGGRMWRAGAPGMIHQSDYLVLLAELIARRIDRFGLLTDVAAP